MMMMVLVSTQQIVTTKYKMQHRISP